MRASGVYVCVGGRGRKTEDCGAGSRVKGGTDPGGALGSQWQSGAPEGVVSDAGPGFNRDVRCDKDKPDRRVEWSCRDRAATLSITYTALSTVVTPCSLVFTYSFYMSQSCGSVQCVESWCVSTFVSSRKVDDFINSSFQLRRDGSSML